MPDQTVRTLMPLEIDRAIRPAGSELTLPEADALALVELGRAELAGAQAEADAAAGTDEPGDAAPPEADAAPEITEPATSQEA